MLTVAFVVRPEILKTWAGHVPMSPRDVDNVQQRFRRGENNWIVQGHALLREELAQLGFRVILTSSFPPDAIAIAHRDALNSFWTGAHRCRVIGVRADRPPLFGCECEIVQNDLTTESSVTRYIPHWPQPGLIKRRSDRPERIEQLAYLGRAEGTSPWLTGEDFRSRLARLGVNFRISDRNWNDYSAIDAILSVRDESPQMLSQKPASKLTNSWLAEVPALLGDEPAFRRLRRSELDYIRVSSASDVVDFIEALNRDPRRYCDMVANGKARGVEFTREALARRWIDVILSVARRPPRQVSWSQHVATILRQKRSARQFKAAESLWATQRNAAPRA